MTAAPANLFAEYARFLRRGGGFPDDYACVDIETCGGLNVASPRVLPVELGWCVVEGRRPACNGAVVLNWLALPEIDYTAFVRELTATRVTMREKGYNYRFTPRVLEEEGVDPRDGLATLAGILADNAAAGIPTVGHNVLSFDRPILERCFRDWCGLPLAMPIEQVIDTMCIARARQKADFALPRPGETVSSWYGRLQRGPEQCDLYRHCGTTYMLDIDFGRAHTAEYDTYANHLLVEAMRKLAEA